MLGINVRTSPSPTPTKPNHHQITILIRGTLDFGKEVISEAGKISYSVAAPLLGIISAAYNLGAILAVAVVPWAAQRYGRRWSIFIGSVFQCVGAVLQTFSQNGMYFSPAPLCNMEKSQSKFGGRPLYQRREISTLPVQSRMRRERSPPVTSHTNIL